MSDHGQEPDMDDPLPALQAAIDQDMMMLPHLARLAWGHYAAFKADGFTDQQALYLTATKLVSSPGPAV